MSTLCFQTCMETEYVYNFDAIIYHQNKPDPFCIYTSFFTHILFNVYVALIDVVSLVVNVMNNSNLLTTAKQIIYQTKYFYLFCEKWWKQNNSNSTQLSNKRKQYVYLSILSL